MNGSNPPRKRAEGLLAVVHPIDGVQTPAITLKLFRQNGEREMIAQELTLSVRQAERLAQFFAAVARESTPRRRRRLSQP
jgi:hypothetical protein